MGRRCVLGAVTLMLVASVADRGLAQSGNGQRGQATPARQDPPRPEGPPRVPFWKDPAVIKEISLTPDQAKRIESIWTKREQEMHGVVTEHRKQQAELERLVAERKVGPDVIGLQVDRVEAQRTTLNKSWTVMMYRFSLIMTPEQNAALKAYSERNRRNRR
jgi:Spy/CpxP family protein refolding chaperone